MSELVWGVNAPYGTGLSFTAQLVSSNTPSGALSLVQAKVTEVGSGEYLVTYTAESGSDFQ